ncbi:hypothetical protein D9O40_00700 [Clostridium autoethanogenum]|uniref:Uncharacterized protein n=1 Tax=Clostridium autoethanogenum TaxID=84023 RepID=A0A3M0T2R1_9CLOT|nr:hypothetical protein [Clostridium autoethanogenum]RMD04904.1 hypothetical protein D9O40_00700 [Clostridium autoethanogenum]
MSSIKLGDWTIKSTSSSYTLWSAQNKIMVEFNNRKVAVIELDTDNNILISSTSAKCEIDKNDNTITIVDADDFNHNNIPVGAKCW